DRRARARRAGRGPLSRLDPRRGGRPPRVRIRRRACRLHPRGAAGVTAHVPPRVVITGIGAVSALGGDVAALTAGLIEGRCGIGPLTLFPYRGRCATAAEVPEAVPAAVSIAPATARRLSRPDRVALMATSEACPRARLGGR